MLAKSNATRSAPAGWSAGLALLPVAGTSWAASPRPGLVSFRQEAIPHEIPAFGFGFALLAALALAYAGYRLRVRRLEDRGRELERLVSERTLALAEKHRELEEAYAWIEEASPVDPFTGLRNRRYLEQTIEADVEIAARRHEDGEEGSDLVFLLFALDPVQSVDSTDGHAAADAALVQTAGLLSDALRASDTLVQWGAEELLAVARFVDRREAPRLAEKIRFAVASHPFLLEDGTELRRTCSLGFAAYPFKPGQPRPIRWEEVVDLAGFGLASAKRSGRDRWVGIEAGKMGDPREALFRFRKDPEASLAGGEVRRVTMAAHESAFST